LSEHIVNQASSATHLRDTLPKGNTIGQQVRLHGENVSINKSTSSLIEDAKEEVSLLFKERAEKKLSRREVSTEKKSRNQQVLVEKVEKLMEQLPDLQKNVKLKLLIQRMASNFPATPQQLMRHLEEFSRDPSLQFVALQMLEREARAGGQESALNLGVIRKTVEGLMSSQGEAVRAGLNVSVTANEFASRLNSDTQKLRDVYRDAVLDYGGITATYRSLISRFNEEAFETTRKFLMKALSADYNAQGSSIDRPRLKAIMDDMYALKLLGTIHESCSKLMKKIRDYYGQDRCKSGQDLMSMLLDIKDLPWVQPSQFLDVPTAMNVHDLSLQIYLLREMDTVLREIPLKTYRDPADRERLLEVSREVLDQLFNEEEQEAE